MTKIKWTIIDRIESHRTSCLYQYLWLSWFWLRLFPFSYNSFFDSSVLLLLAWFVILWQCLEASSLIARRPLEAHSKTVIHTTAVQSLSVFAQSLLKPLAGSKQSQVKKKLWNGNFQTNCRCENISDSHGRFCDQAWRVLKLKKKTIVIIQYYTQWLYPNTILWLFLSDTDWFRPWFSNI